MYVILFKDFKRATVPEQVIEKVLLKTILFFSFLMMITQRERTEKNIYIHIFLIFFGKILKKRWYHAKDLPERFNILFEW